MESTESHIKNITNNGFTIIRNGVDINLIDKVVSDFEQWSSLEQNKI